MRLLYKVRRNTSQGNFSLSFRTGFISVLFLFAALSFSQSSNAQVEHKPPAVRPDQIPAPADVQRQYGDNGGSSLTDSLNRLDIETLIRESNRNGAVMRRRMFNYTYTLKKTRRTLNESGKPVGEEVLTFEAYPVRGEHVLIQLSRNGEPLPEWEILNDRRRAGERLLREEKEAKNHSGKNDSASDPEGGYVSAGIYGRPNGKSAWITIDISEILRSSDFSSPRIERLGDREAIALTFRPRDGLSFQPTHQYIPKLTGTVWIDRNDKTVARLEAQLVPQSAKDANQREPVLVYEQQRQPTGDWLPTLIRMNANGNPSIFNGLNWDVSFEFSEYKRFTSNAGDVIIKEPKEPKEP